MKLNKPLMHVRLHQLKFFYWDPRIDPREPEYDPLLAGDLFYAIIGSQRPSFYASFIDFNLYWSYCCCFNLFIGEKI